MKYLIPLLILLVNCGDPISKSESTEVELPSIIEHDTVEGIKFIDIQTTAGTFKVWTKKIGDNPSKKVLILHGGPGCSHKYLSNFEPYFNQTDIEYYYYDQLGSGFSDHPADTSLWNIPRFVEEVEQVRKALGLNDDNFFLYGQSWGGILAIEYALKYQANLKGLIISNMMASCPEYTKYVNETLGPQLPDTVFRAIREIEEAEDFDNPRYMDLLNEYYYTAHVLRMSLDDWPEIINEDFNQANSTVYVSMQGPSEFGIKGNAKLKNWDRTADLQNILTPTLTIGAAYDTMDPKHMEWMSTAFAKGSYHHCPNGSHLAMWDDGDVYFKGLIDFIDSVD